MTSCLSAGQRAGGESFRPSGRSKPLWLRPPSVRPLTLCLSQILGSCPDIKWHFIGHLQKNNVNKLLGE